LPQEPSAAPRIRSDATLSIPRTGKLIASRGAINTRRLIADQQYFGLQAAALCAGAGRALLRISGQPPEQARIDARNLGEDFHLDSAASSALLSALLAGGMLYPDGTGQYRPTRLFREYALASVVAPLSRERAKALIDRACSLAASINADWDRVPFQIEMVAVSGSYMTRRDQLSELSLSLVLCPRSESRKPRSGSMLSKDEGLRQAIKAIRALSSFIVIRIVVDRKAVQRPFSVVFQLDESQMDASVGGWDRFRDWSASVTRWLAVK
jgi:hypothetical protein